MVLRFMTNITLRTKFIKDLTERLTQLEETILNPHDTLEFLKMCIRSIAIEIASNHKKERDKRNIYYKDNKVEMIKWAVNYQRIKYKTNPGYNIKMRLSNRIRDALRYVNVTKRNRTVDYLGISIPEFRIHLEKQFYVNSKTGEMMSWKNMSKWHMDHIIPCYSYDLTNVDAQKKCFHYTNIRPMWAEENLKKGNRFII